MPSVHRGLRLPPLWGNQGRGGHTRDFGWALKTEEGKAVLDQASKVSVADDVRMGRGLRAVGRVARSLCRLLSGCAPCRPALVRSGLR